MDIHDVEALQRRLDAIPREVVQVVCMNCGLKFTAEVIKGDRFFRCSTCSAARMASMNNEGDVTAPDGVRSSSSGACQAGPG